MSPERPGPRIHRTRQESTALPSSTSIRAETAPRETSAPSFGRAGRSRDDAEVVARWVAELVGEDPDHDLRRPEELVLEVDGPLGRAQRAQCTTRATLNSPWGIDLEHSLGDRAHDLQLDIARRLPGGREAGAAPPRGPRATQAEVLGEDPPTAGPFDPHRDVVPPDAARGTDAVGCRNGSPPSECEVDPPTNATRSSITTVFSWWPST